MSRELSDLLIVLIAILVPTVAILIGMTMPKWLAHRARRLERANGLEAENARLRAALEEVTRRVADVERIVTDDGHRLANEIESLRQPRELTMHDKPGRF